MKTIVFVLCEDHVYGGGAKSISSMKHFNPDFKIVRYGTKEINEVKRAYNCDDIRFIYPLALKTVWEQEKPDLLIRLGADYLVLDSLKDIAEMEYSVAAARNDPDCIGDRDERHNRPDIIRNIPNHEWVNADFICIKSKCFVDEYYRLTLDYWTGRQFALKDYGKIYKGDCQSSLNVVFWLAGGHNIILDARGSNFVYGACGNFDSGNGYCAPSVLSEYGSLVYNWSSWYDIRHNGSNFVMGDKIVRGLHKGGGGAFKRDKLDEDLFHPEIREKIREITNVSN